MALETRPLPVLKGKIAEEFFKRAAECKVSKTKEEIQELIRWVRRTVEEEWLEKEQEWEAREKD
jgi:hypothetical protein